jgi:hypothetical protein
MTPGNHEGGMLITRPFVGSLILLVMAAGCHEWRPQLTSHVERNGLVVEFAPGCDENGISLASSLENITSKEVRIESGSFPWQYDILGTEFIAESSGRYLKRNQSAPMFGRTGPIELAPHERRSGSTPIGFMFPEMQNQLASGQIVTVRWKYRISVTPSEVIEGVISINQDPCRTGAR